MKDSINLADALLDRLLQSKKYGMVCPQTVERICLDSVKRYKKSKDAEKAAREKLHGITGAFLSPSDAAACRSALMNWQENGRSDDLLERALGYHISTKERLPLHETDALFARILEVSGKPARVLDLACGINPLYLGARGIAVHGIDISGTAVRLINEAGADCALPISASCADLLSPNALTNEHFDLALIFKALPLLERERAGSAAQLLQSIDAAFIAVSFPTRTLSGRNVGMQANYGAWMQAHLPERCTILSSFASANELFYILTQARKEK